MTSRAYRTGAAIGRTPRVVIESAGGSGRTSTSGLLLLLVGALALIGFLTGNLDRWLAYLFTPGGTAATSSTAGPPPAGQAAPVGPAGRPAAPPPGYVPPGGLPAVASGNRRGTGTATG